MQELLRPECSRFSSDATDSFATKTPKGTSRLVDAFALCFDFILLRTGSHETNMHNTSLARSVAGCCYCYFVFLVL